jgi:hypothetical protein
MLRAVKRFRADRAVLGHSPLTDEEERAVKTMLFAVGALMSLSAFGVAYAGEGEGVGPNSQFTQVAGVVAQAPGPNIHPVTMAGAATSPQYFFARSHRGTWLFPVDRAGGGN